MLHEPTQYARMELERYLMVRALDPVCCTN
jgi:hypothetical protein